MAGLALHSIQLCFRKFFSPQFFFSLHFRNVGNLKPISDVLKTTEEGWVFEGDERRPLQDDFLLSFLRRRSDEPPSPNQPSPSLSLFFLSFRQTYVSPPPPPCEFISTAVAAWQASTAPSRPSCYATDSCSMAAASFLRSQSCASNHELSNVRELEMTKSILVTHF